MAGSGVQPDLRVELPDGTWIGYAEAGHAEGNPVLFLPGTPGSRLATTWPPAHDFCQDLGIRLIGLDYPGLGLSTFRHFSVAAYPGLVGRFVDALGLQRFALVGYSAGGKYACACAWRLSDRVTRVVLLSSPASPDLPGVRATWSKDYGFWNAVADRAPWLIRAIEAKFARDFRNGRIPKQMLSVIEGSDADKAVAAREDFRRFFIRQSAEGYRQGVRGLAHDWTLEARSWGVPLDRISAPVQLWHGEEDSVQPPEQARILAKILPHAAVNLVPQQGHLIVVSDHLMDVLRSAVNG